MKPVTWIASTLFFVMLLMADSVFAGDYVLAPLPEAYPDRSEFEGELSEPLKDPKACEIYLQNLRYFANHNLPLSCGQPVAPMLAGKIKQVEWENLDPEKYPELFKAVVAKMFPLVRASEEKAYLSEAFLSSKKEQVRTGYIIFRRAKLDLIGHDVLPLTYAPTKNAIAFQIVQFGFNRNDSENPVPGMRCERKAARVLRADYLNDVNLFIASQNLTELYGVMSDLQGGFGYYLNLWLINGQLYGEQYDDEGTVLLSEARSANFVRACLYSYKDSDK